MTDIIEDLEFILQRAIHFLTSLLQSLHARFNDNRHRPLNHRTLVRWLAAFVPRPRNPSLRLQSPLGAAQWESPPVLEGWGSSGSFKSAMSYSSLKQLVEEDLGDNLVRFRLGCGDEDSSDVFDDPNFHSHDQPDCLTSTPNFHTTSYCSLVSSNPSASLKLAEMEEELATLRKQIALLVIAQESSAFSKTLTVVNDGSSNTSQAAAAVVVPLPRSPSSSASSLHDSGCESESCPLPVQSIDCIQEPNPPPPPPVPISSTAFSLPGCLQQKKASLLSRADTKSTSDRGRPNMADVLKGLSTVKLRAVDRSPGGTPLRKQPKEEPSDPAAIIAQALKKKFASQRGFSPDSDKENDTDSFTSETSSPFGQNLLKKTKRRLSLLNNSSESWSPVASPLRELNG